MMLIDQLIYHSVYYAGLQPARINGDYVELWNAYDIAWKRVQHTKPEDIKYFKKYGYPILTYAKTWAEPYEGMEE